MAGQGALSAPCGTHRALTPITHVGALERCSEFACAANHHSEPRVLHVGQKARIDLVIDCAGPAKLAEFWREALDYRDYYTDTAVSVLVPKDGIASPLVLQRVPEPKVGKNRMHLDIVVDDIEPEIARLVALGAERLDAGVQSLGDTLWVRMADPEHNEFCVCTGVEW